MLRVEKCELFLSQHVLNNSARSLGWPAAASLQFNLKSGACGRPFVGEGHSVVASTQQNSQRYFTLTNLETLNPWRVHLKFGCLSTKSIIDR